MVQVLHELCSVMRKEGHRPGSQNAPTGGCSSADGRGGARPLTLPGTAQAGQRTASPRPNQSQPSTPTLSHKSEKKTQKKITNTHSHSSHYQTPHLSRCVARQVCPRPVASQPPQTPSQHDSELSASKFRQTEVVIFGPEHFREKLSSYIVTLDGISLACSTTVRNLGS